MANLYFNTSKNPENYRFQEKFQESDYTLTLLKWIQIDLNLTLARKPQTQLPLNVCTSQLCILDLKVKPEQYKLLKSYKFENLN